MEGANRALSKEKSNPPGLDPEHAYLPDGETSTIDHIVQGHLGSDLPELSREPGRPHSPPIKQEEEELFDRVFSEDELVANILMRLKEEPDDQKLSPRDENETSSPVTIKEEEVDHKPLRPRIKLLISSGRIKEESDAEGDKGPISQVFVDQNIKLEIGVKDENSHSPGSYPENPIKVVQGIDRLRSPWERSIAALSSPYCGVISKPSWESTRVYHKARGGMLHLNLGETVFKVHRSVILTKIPRLPLLYADLNDEDEPEHFLTESLHNVNLLIYWIYHECLPPLAVMKRPTSYGVSQFEGLNWDRIELYKFAEKLWAFELMECITKYFA